MKESASIAFEAAPSCFAARKGTADSPTCHSIHKLGFTLMELLVVIGVIAILASLLLAVLGQVKNAASSVKCKSNLKQIGLALQLYVDDHKVYPSGHISFPRGQRLFWADHLVGPYLSFQESETNRNGILNCPARRLGTPSSIDYGYNYEGYAGFGLGPDVYVGQPGNIFVRENDVASPIDMIAAGDGLVRQGPYVFNDHGPVLTRIIPIYDASRVQENGPVSQGRSEKRHAGLINLVFCDSHVGTLTLKRAFIDDCDDDLAKWNRDHQPHRAEWERALKSHPIP
jgi:prepilin-type N-terminal cleavage/methylation domain-containing protein/prepilin-type processing-associated H-X9-DG protein